MTTSRTDALRVADRYATAIFALGEEAGATDRIAEELTQLADAAVQNAELAAALKNPLLASAQKAALLQAIAKGAHKLTLQTLATIGGEGRAELLTDIAAALAKKRAAARDELVAEVTSARPLSGAMQGQLKDALKEATGKDVQMTLKEDPSVLGGVSIRMGSLLLDATLQGALTTMRRELLAPTNA